MTPEDPSRDPLERLLKKTMRDDLPPDVEARLRSRLALFRQDVSRSRPPSWRTGWTTRGLLRASAAMACAALLIIALQSLFDNGSAPTWAQVNAGFAAAPFVNATIYIKNGVLDEPLQLELWMSKGGQLRMRAGNQILFGRNGEIAESFTLPGTTPPRAGVDEARRMVQEFVAGLGASGAFSFETLVKALPGKTPQTPPLPNQDASVARDLAVFDMVGDSQGDWVRIWALRESRLPVRVLFWDPGRAGSVDVLLSYFNEQPAEFFDPAAFRKTIEGMADPASQAYSLLKDPGGRPWSPQDNKRPSAAPGI